MSAKENSGAGADAARIVSLLVTAAKGDTVFRDLYLERAVSQLTGMISEHEYRNLSGEQARVDALLHQTQAEVRNQNWERVKQLSATVDRLRQVLAQKSGLLALASTVYDADYVHIDPFSSGLAGFTLAPGETLASLRQALVVTLRDLAKTDSPFSELYTERQRHFEQKVHPAAETSMEHAPAAKGSGVAELRVQAQLAAERGDMATLQLLAEAITAASEAQAPKTATRAADDEQVAMSAGWKPASNEPFPPAAVERSAQLGLAHVRTKELFAGVPALLTDFIARHAWQPGASAQDVAQEGAVHLRERLAALDLPDELKGPMVEMAVLFALHPFINSGGVRYFGAGAGEYLLVETFPEDAEPAAKDGVPALLGLDRRRGLARTEIEDALRTRGTAVLKEQLGLDPREFRLVCIPFDVYVRVGVERGWGGLPQWTHVDGYAVRRGGQLGALAAGHVRYGGLQDLVIFGRADRRDAVTTRFCVVRRARLLLTAG